MINRKVFFSVPEILMIIQFLLVASTGPSIAGFIDTRFSAIGVGSMEVKGNIFDPSRQIEYFKKTRIDDKGLVYPPYTWIQWVGDKSPAGYMPGHYGCDSITLCEIHNTVFTTECVIVKPDGYHTFKHACHPRYWHLGQKYHYPHTEYTMYDKVICIGHQHSSDWGHWFLEILPGFAALPQELLENCVVAIPFAREYVVDGFDFIGIKSYQLITGDNKAYYANTLYVIESLWCGDLNRFIIVNMKKLFIQKLHITSFKSNRYVLVNRPPSLSRHFGNFPEFMTAVKTKYPQFPWEPVTMYKSLHDQGVYFAQIRFLFAVHGSILANEIFMATGSVVIELQMESWLLSFLNLGPMTGIFQVAGRDTSIKYNAKEPNHLDIDYGLRLVTRGLVCLKEIEV